MTKSNGNEEDFSFSFSTPPFCQWIRLKTINHIWYKQKNEYCVVQKLMIFIPKWDKRNNERKCISHFYKVLDTISRMNNNKAENRKIVLGIQIRNQEKHRRKERPECCQKKVSWIAGQLLLCLNPFVVFFNLVKDWSWEIVFFEKILLNSPGLLDSIKSSFESLVRLDLSVHNFRVVVSVFDPFPVEVRNFRTINVRLRY